MHQDGRRGHRVSRRPSVQEARHGHRDLVPGDADVGQEVVVQGVQRAYGGTLPVCPFQGARDPPEGPDEGLAQAIDAPRHRPGHGPGLELAPQELVVVELVHGHPGAGHQMVLVTMVDDGRDAPLEAGLHERPVIRGLILSSIHFRFPRVVQGYSRCIMTFQVAYKGSDYKGSAQTRSFGIFF